MTIVLIGGGALVAVAEMITGGAVTKGPDRSKADRRNDAVDVFEDVVDTVGEDTSGGHV